MTKKIMFNDKYGLTQAVLDGRKTQTRRLASSFLPDAVRIGYARFEIANGRELRCWTKGNSCIKFNLPYKVGEVVAVAQSYCSIADELENCKNATCAEHYEKNVQKASEYISWMGHPGFNNKMLVGADMMIHQIRITDVRVERLQEITDECCLKEGITDMGAGGSLRYSFTENVKQTTGDIIAFSNNFATAKEAFAHLINKVSRKDVWSNNPYVFVYDFELIK